LRCTCRDSVVGPLMKKFEATAVGIVAIASGNLTTAIGDRAFAGGNNNNPSTTAIGALAQAGTTGAFQSNATAIGANALANAANATALGQAAQANGAGGVALGQNSVSNDSNVSVGNAATGLTRTIQNVAAGANGTDAVNVNQLNTRISGVGVNSFDLPPPVATGLGSTAVAVGSVATGD